MSGRINEATGVLDTDDLPPYEAALFVAAMEEYRRKFGFEMTTVTRLYAAGLSPEEVMDTTNDMLRIERKLQKGGA